MPKELREVKKEGLEKQLSTDPNAAGRERVEEEEAATAKKSGEAAADGGVTPEKLQHLLRLSALPPPKDKEEESKLLRDLRNQIHFVKQIQRVNTQGVEPLVAIRDETPEHIESSTVRLEDLKPWLDQEEKVGRAEFVRSRRPRDVKVGEMDWDPFEMGVGSEAGSGRRHGRYFVVKKARKLEKEQAVAADAEDDIVEDEKFDDKPYHPNHAAPQ